jgi:hypothetical protein
MMETHISNCHRIQKQNLLYTARQLFEEGHVQCFFINGHGSNYFRVDPVLSGVQPDSDFDLWYMLLLENDHQQDLSAATMIGDNDEGLKFDLPPFLAKVGWVAQLQGYSWMYLRRCAALPLANENPHFHKVMEITHVYFWSISQAEVTQNIHPTILNTLNNWKRLSHCTSTHN